ncbi:MAG: amino acid ABC transporter ATP-binding protein [Planctomycetes bacterium]|nr:amino acid ABC transporter ATP-binding protein [Planctomycetota bacterium]
MIKVETLNFSYTDGTQALFDINCEFPSEHIFAVMGDSGSGKTTLLNCIARFLMPQTGKITIDDQDTSGMAEIDLRNKVGVVFQRLHLFPHLNILQNMMLAPTLVQNRPVKELRKEASEMLERLGIPELAESYPSQVSGGQAQRAAIARGLMLKPSYMLLDEPTSALDARTSEEFALWLKELREDTSFIAVTHDLLFARAAARHGMYMEQGKIASQGVIEDVTAAHC